MLYYNCQGDRGRCSERCATQQLRNQIPLAIYSRKRIKMKDFFKIEKPYTFEWNDLRALITVINVTLIILFGLSGAWFGLPIAILGIIKELTGKRHINCLISYLANIILNINFLILLYRS